VEKWVWSGRGGAGWQRVIPSFGLHSGLRQCGCAFSAQQDSGPSKPKDGAFGLPGLAYPELFELRSNHPASRNRDPFDCA